MGLGGGISTYAAVGNAPMDSVDPLGLQAQTGAWPTIPVTPCASCHSPTQPVPPPSIPVPAPNVVQHSNGYSWPDEAEDALPTTDAKPKKGCDDDGECERQFDYESDVCRDQYGDLGPKWRPIYAACMARAKQRWQICVSNGGHMPPDAPQPWVDSDWEGWPTIHDLLSQKR